jgi:ribosomal protein S18 acetylase RimI-like enzyme
MNIQVSRLRESDAQNGAKVLDQFGKQPDLNHLRQLLASDGHFFVAASISGAWAGYAHGYELVRPDHGSMLFLYSLDVLPQYRRKGVGTALLSFMRTLAETRDMRELFVFTTRSNEAAVELYKATGGTIENGDDLLFVYPTHAANQIA